jgi:Domain of unknown function (DUF3846)
LFDFITVIHYPVIVLTFEEVIIMTGMLKGIKVSGRAMSRHEIPNTLEALQELVGGYIETAPMGEGFVGICNEEGMLINLPQNMLGFYGDVFICKVNVDEGELESLTDEEQTYVMNRITGDLV